MINAYGIFVVGRTTVTIKFANYIISYLGSLLLLLFENGERPYRKGMGTFTQIRALDLRVKINKHCNRAVLESRAFFPNFGFKPETKRTKTYVGDNLGTYKHFRVIFFAYFVAFYC